MLGLSSRCYKAVEAWSEKTMLLTATTQSVGRGVDLPTHLCKNGEMGERRVEDEEWEEGKQVPKYRGIKAVVYVGINH